MNKHGYLGHAQSARTLHLKSAVPHVQQQIGAVGRALARSVGFEDAPTCHRRIENFQGATANGVNVRSTKGKSARSIIEDPPLRC